MKRGILRGLSIGYDFDREGVRHPQENGRGDAPQGVRKFVTNKFPGQYSLGCLRQSQHWILLTITPLLRKEFGPNLGKLDGSRAFSAVVRNLIDLGADWIAAHELRIVRLQQSERRYVLHSRIEPSIVEAGNSSRAVQKVSDFSG
jgi:hypothetical protein